MPKNITYAIKKQAFVAIKRIDIHGLVHSPYNLAARSQISTIYSLLNLFLAFKRMYTQKMFMRIMYTKPIIAPYKPASEIDLGLEIKAIPKYIFITFAAVKNQGEVLLFLV